jgi:hypothetical protein
VLNNESVDEEAEALPEMVKESVVPQQTAIKLIGPAPEANAVK